MVATETKKNIFFFSTFCWCRTFSYNSCKITKNEEEIRGEINIKSKVKKKGKTLSNVSLIFFISFKFSFIFFFSSSREKFLISQVKFAEKNYSKMKNEKIRKWQNFLWTNKCSKSENRNLLVDKIDWQIHGIGIKINKSWIIVCAWKFNSF